MELSRSARRRSACETRRLGAGHVVEDLASLQPEALVVLRDVVLALDEAPAVDLHVLLDLREALALRRAHLSGKERKGECLFFYNSE